MWASSRSASRSTLPRIDSNPARDTITKFGKQGMTPDPYTIEQMRSLLANVKGTWWEFIIVLGGLYGLRVGEILGLRWRNVDLENGTFAVVEQLPYRLPLGTTEVEEMAPVKSSERTLPITESTRPYEVPQHRSSTHPLLTNLPHISLYVFIAQFCGAGHHLDTTAPKICIYIHWINLNWHHKSGHYGHHFLIFRQGHPQQGKRKPLENPVLSRGLWRSGWDSNPRALADNLISSVLHQNDFM